MKNSMVNVVRLFGSKLLVSSGYRKMHCCLRYDHDGLVIEEHLNIQPIDHIDFFFSGANTFKVGLHVCMLGHWKAVLSAMGDAGHGKYNL